MSQVISVTPEQLRSQARVYTEAREQIDQANQRVRRMNDEIAAQWKGRAFESYLTQYEQLNKHVVEFKNLLGDIHKQLNMYAETAAQRDAEDARRFGLS